MLDIVWSCPEGGGHASEHGCHEAVDEGGGMAGLMIKAGFVRFDGQPANTKYRPNVGLMLGQRRRRWPNIKPSLVDVFRGSRCDPSQTHGLFLCIAGRLPAQVLVSLFVALIPLVFLLLTTGQRLSERGLSIIYPERVRCTGVG